VSAALRHGAEAHAARCAAPARESERFLSGHSGARVVLHNRGSDSFVRKTAADAAASARLKAQADKQHSFWMLGLPFPKVRGQAIDAAGIGSFDMNYIPGRTVADAVMNGGAFDPAAVVKAVERLMNLFLMSRGRDFPAPLFSGKIRDVAGRIGMTQTDPGLRDAARDCARMLMARNWEGIPESACHGDLTLENILLTSGKSIAFIDCDAPFASSYWLDFGKLFQDIEGYWCLRALYGAEDGGVRLLNATQKLHGLGARFRRLAAELDGPLVDRLPQLAALGLFRAIPYTQDEAVRRFLCRRIVHLLET
jgi:aminoglycoside phosphotransferase